MTRTGRRAGAALAVGALVLSGCSSSQVVAPGSSVEAPVDLPAATARPSPAQGTVAPRIDPAVEQGRRLQPVPGTVPPPWLGTRALPLADDGFGVRRATPPALRTRRFTLPDRLPALPGRGFTARVTAVPEQVAARSTWRPGCPVELDDLRWVRLTFHGFDDARHTGELLVAADVADDVVAVFRRLWQARFPLEEMRVVRAGELDAPPYGDGNNTTAFVCRSSVGSPDEFSAHAYGLAIDVNPFQNPYVRDDLVIPERAVAYVDRTRPAPGTIRPGGPVVTAFAGTGWPWGGDWQQSSDWQHFSATGR